MNVPNTYSNNQERGREQRVRKESVVVSTLNYYELHFAIRIEEFADNFCTIS